MHSTYSTYGATHATYARAAYVVSGNACSAARSDWNSNSVAARNTAGRPASTQTFALNFCMHVGRARAS